MNTANYPAADFPLLDGRAVTQAHADYCAENGHARHEVDGQLTGICPRCGAGRPDADAFPIGTRIALDLPRRTQTGTVVAHRSMSRRNPGWLSLWIRWDDAPGASHTSEPADRVRKIDDAPAWVHKIAYRVNDTMTAFDVMESNNISRAVERGDTVEILREWWANPATREVVEVRPLPVYPGAAPWRVDLITDPADRDRLDAAVGRWL